MTRYSKSINNCSYTGTSHDSPSFELLPRQQKALVSLVLLLVFKGCPEIIYSENCKFTSSTDKVSVLRSSIQPTHTHTHTKLNNTNETDKLIVSTPGLHPSLPFFHSFSHISLLQYYIPRKASVGHNRLRLLSQCKFQYKHLMQLD